MVLSGHSLLMTRVLYQYIGVWSIICEAITTSDLDLMPSLISAGQPWLEGSFLKAAFNSVHAFKTNLLPRAGNSHKSPVKSGTFGTAVAKAIILLNKYERSFKFERSPKTEYEYYLFTLACAG